MEEKIPVYMDSAEIEQFKLFRQYQEKITDIIRAGIFDIKGGSAVIHFNPDGLIMRIDIQTVPFLRRKK